MQAVATPQVAWLQACIDLCSLLELDDLLGCLNGAIHQGHSVGKLANMHQDPAGNPVMGRHVRFSDGKKHPNFNTHLSPQLTHSPLNLHLDASNLRSWLLPTAGRRLTPLSGNKNFAVLNLCHLNQWFYSLSGTPTGCKLARCVSCSVLCAVCL